MNLSDYSDEELKEELRRRLPPGFLSQMYGTIIGYEGPWQHEWENGSPTDIGEYPRVCKNCNKMAPTWMKGSEELFSGKTPCPKHPDRVGIP
jgi:hypothetical protein